MPRLLALDELSEEQHSWWDNYYGQRGESAAFHENIVAVQGREGPPIDSTHYSHDRQPILTANDSQQTAHHRYSHVPEPTSPYGSFSPPRGPDNRSTIFRGRAGGGRPISRPDYYQYHSYYQPPPPRYASMMPPAPPSNSGFREEHNELSSPPKSYSKRERSIDDGVTPIEVRHITPIEHSHYRNQYAHLHTSGSMIPYFGPEEVPQYKRHCGPPENSVWHHVSDDDSRDRKMCPVYHHLGDKLTWQQSFENLLVYKKTYGDCNVPQKYKENPKLGGWVNKQRKKKKNPAKYGRLSEAQIRQLTEIGFKWNLETTCHHSS